MPGEKSWEACTRELFSHPLYPVLYLLLVISAFSEESLCVCSFVFDQILLWRINANTCFNPSCLSRTSLFLLLLLTHRRKRLACSSVDWQWKMLPKALHWWFAKSAKGYSLQQKIKTSGWKQDSSLVIAAFLPSVALSWEDYVGRWKPQIYVSWQDR